MSKLRNRTYITEATMAGSFLRASQSDLEPEQERLFNRLAIVIENDGRAYRSKDAKGAVERASRDHMRWAAEELRHDLSVIRPLLESYLKQRWARIKRE